MTKKSAICILALTILAGCKTQINTIEDTRITCGGSISKAAQIRIDSLINDAIQQRAMPGCRIMAVRDRKVILNKCYGYLDYDSTSRVNDSTYYDLASVTKVAASSLAMMAMYEDRKIQLDKPLNKYLKGISDNGATLRDALAHQAGFKAWVPLRTKLPDLSRCLLETPDKYDTAQARKDIITTLASTELGERGVYTYSDLGFYIYPEFVRKFYNMDFEDFLNTRFYRPLGIHPVYNPLRFMDISNIAPTENDTIWRRRIVRGTVHDEGAYMMGGISGHAGLFATAGDLAILFQMILNRGEYGGMRFFRPETIDLFTAQAFPDNRRGLVFDKPVIDTSLNGTPSRMASRESYGHTGFTGSFVWADPKNNLLLIFLCNSTFPNRSSLLGKLNVRTQLHDVFYMEE